MDKLVAILQKPSKYVKKDDDFTDRLNNKYTVVVIVVFAAVVSMYSYTGKPITCWCPKHFTGSWIKYTNNYCWVKNTYYLQMHKEIPKAHEDHDYLLYYQWVPFILLAQACFFYAPNVIWHGLNQKAGVDADNILESAETLDNTKSIEKRNGMVNFITSQMDRFLRTRKIREKQPPGFTPKKFFDVICCRWIGKKVSGYLVLLFLFTKLLYILNVIGQLFVLSKLFNTSYNTFGVDFIKNIQDGNYFANSPVFPRVTFCDFNVRVLGNLQRYTVQCVLPINLYTEKVYLFLWFWFVLVAAATVASFFMWAIRAVLYKDKVTFILNHIPAEAKDERYQGVSLPEDFVSNYLKQDGAFLLRLVAHNTNNLTTTDIISSLYDFWKTKVKGREEDSYNEEDDTASLPEKTELL